MKNQSIIRINAKKPPVVELDSTIRAAYVRFSHNRVAETRVVTDEECTVTVDMDAQGSVVGIELVGVKEFTVTGLLKQAGLQAPKSLLNRTTYVPAQLQAA